MTARRPSAANIFGKTVIRRGALRGRRKTAGVVQDLGSDAARALAKGNERSGRAGAAHAAPVVVVAGMKTS